MNNIISKNSNDEKEIAIRRSTRETKKYNKRK